MNLEAFFEKFELFAEAPNWVLKLRELVLELAVQGRLAVQDPNDEPPSAQLERIAARKAARGRVGRTNTRATAVSDPATSAGPVPRGWAKVPLADLVTVLNGRAYAKGELLSEGTPVLRVGNLFTSNHWYYSNLDLEPDKYCEKGDLLFAWSASFGPFIWPGPKAIYHYHIWKLELHSEVDLASAYLYWFLQNETQEIKRTGHGVSMLHMTKEKMEKIEVALPPLAEQKRIVSKVDELMALCDQLEAQQAGRESLQARLARASLARLAKRPSSANLDFLFHRSNAIAPGDLRKAILTLAVDGTLGQSGSTEASEAEVGEVVDLLGGYAFKSEWFSKSQGVRLVRNQNIGHGELDWSQTEYLPNDRAREFGKWALRPGDLVLSLNRPFISTGLKLAWITDADCPSLLVQRIVCLRPDPERLLAQYLFLWCNAPHFYRDAHVVPSSGVPYIAPNLLAKMKMRLPPLAEQRRIAAKVAELMALVDALETQLATARTTAESLLAAALAELTIWS